ncbi:MAG: hypothetical protein LUG12_00720 [Erysipelotrichaceae bacterium]|nr:hypothetical protein [Erysipelotrichaceae bacterium]
MFDGLLLIISFLAGMAGTWIGGTQAFICTGLIGILSTVLAAAGVSTGFLDTYVLNGFFLPCIIFNGACVATAYAAKHYDIRGFETGRTLAFTMDTGVLLVGGCAGLLGYVIYALVVYSGISIDQGAVSVITVGVLGRLLLNQEQNINKANIHHLMNSSINFWTYQILFGIGTALAMSIFAKETGLYTIGFSISAMSLVFCYFDPTFPATHHITLVAGYAIMQTGNILVGTVFGLLAHLTCQIFGYIFNTECGTHIDPPAVAIALYSFIIFMFF